MVALYHDLELFSAIVVTVTLLLCRRAGWACDALRAGVAGEEQL